MLHTLYRYFARFQALADVGEPFFASLTPFNPAATVYVIAAHRQLTGADVAGRGGEAGGHWGRASYGSVGGGSAGYEEDRGEGVESVGRVRSAAGPVAEGVEHGNEGAATGGAGVEAWRAQQQTQQQMQQQAQQQEWEGRYSGGGSSRNSAPAADDAYRATEVLSAGPSLAEVLSHAVLEAPHDVQLLVALGEEMCRMGKVRLC